jgi:hypothetical protein
MLIDAFIEKFACTSEEVSFFYKTFSEEFKNSHNDEVKEKCCDFILNLIHKLQHKALKSL